MKIDTCKYKNYNKCVYNLVPPWMGKPQPRIVTKGVCEGCKVYECMET